MPEQLESGDRQPPRRLLTFSSGGWVILLTGIVCLVIIAWAITPALLRSAADQPPGDGEHVASYLFDLSSSVVPVNEILPAMHHRDMVPTVDSASHSEPDMAITEASGSEWYKLRWADMQKRNEPEYSKFLLPNDLVIGISLNGESCAYPMSVMYVHEIVNDTIGGVPVAITYNFLGDCTMAFDRRLSASRIALFGHSGLVYNSNMLMYDRLETPPSASAPQPASAPDSKKSVGGECLWSQLLMRAVTGTDAANHLSLKPLHYDLTTWEAWTRVHPDTLVLNRNMSMAGRYPDAAPKPYFQVENELRFPVSPAAIVSKILPMKTPIVVVQTPTQRRLYTVRFLAKKAAESQARSRTWSDTIDGHVVNFEIVGVRDEVSVFVSSPSIDPLDLLITHVFWFAWHAMYPEDVLTDI